MLGEIENTGGAKFAYTWGADGLVSRRNLRDSVTEWYHFGAQGETRAITNIAGQVISTYSYDAYGNPFCSSEPGETNPFKYGGKVGYYSEGGAGLILAGARWYSPNLRRWISRDPIRYEGGANLYEYVRGRPTHYLNPLGLDTVIIYGKPTEGNPFGHVAITTTGNGVQSFGTETPKNGSVIDYLKKQSRYRDQVLYRLHTTPAQEKRIMDYLRPLDDKLPRVPGAGSSDTCATRTNGALGAAGLGTRPPVSPFPFETEAFAAYCIMKNGGGIAYITKGSSNFPEGLEEFEP